jgi:hypothetical protein
MKGEGLGGRGGEERGEIIVGGSLAGLSAREKKARMFG